MHPDYSMHQDFPEERRPGDHLEPKLPEMASTSWSGYRFTVTCPRCCAEVLSYNYGEHEAWHQDAGDLTVLRRRATDETGESSL